MERFITAVERIAGLFLGVVALITFAEALLRYAGVAHIPDGFVFDQLLQGIAICWGIATATYADRHVTVDVLHSFAAAGLRRALDTVAYTLNFLFLAAFGVMINFKVYATLKAGERSVELGMPMWIGYALAAAGIVVTVVLAAVRWWEVVSGRATTGKAQGG